MPLTTFSSYKPADFSFSPLLNNTIPFRFLHTLEATQIKSGKNKLRLNIISLPQNINGNVQKLISKCLSHKK